MIPFVCLLICSLRIATAYGSDCQPPTEYRHTLSGLSQAVLHCATLPAAERLPCELKGALDSQGRPPKDRSFRLPRRPPVNYRPKSCKFREDNIYSLYPYSMPSSPILNTVMEKYMAMHERCMNIDFSILNDNIYSSPNRSSAPICQYLLWQANDQGLGNRLLSLVSAFLYAIVSARVLLIDYPEYNSLFCEPFTGSTIHIPPAARFNPHLGPPYLAFRDARCGPCTWSTNSICSSRVVNLHLHYLTPTREHESISCPMGYARLRNVPFVILSKNNIYLVPGLYLNPVLSPLLDILFPQRNPFHLLSRFILVPNDAMWDRISSNLDLYASRRIGIQVREFHENLQYTHGFDTNILNCIMKKGGLAPKRIRHKGHSNEHVSIYMATLSKRHLQAMKSNLKVLTELTGEEFRLSFQKLDGREGHDVTHQQEAMIDIWVLSFSHVLVTCRMSTFGYIATALSGTTATILAEEAGKGCYLGVGHDPCFLAAPMSLSCVQDEPVTFSLQDMIRNYSKMQVCPSRWGWALVPGNVIYG